ncbi:Bug family tripartite tricarboxylate transporter substrate binding protein [Bordetella bronchiseptica]|uniref:Bug family tripartite tricarboxylate transporter substrate binding protein n=1 Tax=Bordetella bronchiseptica TaxID=518 RepID=UPI0013F63159|nr:tripartite tricarboxylate transporter substrate binding protein [Bordetella bronchiseptica]
MQPRLTALHSALAALALCLPAGQAHAQADAAYPARPITLIVPFSAGGGSDVVARILATGLGSQLKQTVIVENRTGAAGNIGAEAVARARPDGYTLLFGSMGVMSVNSHLYRNMPLQPERDLAPVGRIYDTPHVIVVGQQSTLKSLPQLIEQAKARPDALTYASAGNGTSTHLVGALFMHETGTRLMHVPYKGNAPALNDTMAGHVDMMFDQATNSTGQIQAARLRALAATSHARIPDLPDVPTVAELGYPELEVTSWTVLAAPKATPAATMATLSAALKKTLADPAIKEKVRQTGGVINYQDLPSTTEFVNRETARWGALIQSAGITAN